MPNTLEELLKDVIAIQKRDAVESADRPCYQIVTDPVRPWSGASTRAAMLSPSMANTATSVVSEKAACALPLEIMQELKMPLAAEKAFEFLQQFYKQNNHRPFLQLKCRSVLYFENDESQNLLRVFIGSADNLKLRGNDRAGSFIIDSVIEFQQVYTLSDDEQNTAVRLRSRKPEDFLSSPDRAQGKAIVPQICFALFQNASEGVSTFTIKPEYVNVKQWAQLQARRQA